MMGFNQPQAPTGNSLNLSMTGAPAGTMGGGSMMNNGFSGGYSGGYSAPSNNWYAQAQQPNSMMSAFLGSATGMPNQGGILPPTENEILMTMLNTQLPVERFVQSNTFNLVLDILGQMMTFSLLNVLKEANFNFDDELGVFKLDPTSLPSHLQTMSPENIMAQMSGLQNDVNSKVSNADNTRMQTLQRAESSMMHGALQAAMADPGMMQGAAEAGGSFLRTLMTGGR
jgi:hypothetical protein